MAYNLAHLTRMARRSDRGRRVFAIPGVALPLSMRDALLALEVKLLRAWEAAYRLHVLPRYELPVRDGAVRDDAQDIGGGMEAADGDLTRLLLILAPELRDWVVRAERYHRGQFAKNVLTATGVDLSTTVGLAENRQTLEAVVANLVNLTKGLNDDTRKALEDIVWRGFTERTPRSQVAREIRQALETKRSRAMLIARDQTTKLAAVLDEERQREAGITKYRWRHSRKLRPRPTHVERDGKLFEWRKPPHDGHPGFAINCGCKAEAYFSLDDL